MTDDDVLEHAHRIATQYKHTSDLRYSFTNLHMLDFARAIEARVHEELRKLEPVGWQLVPKEPTLAMCKVLSGSGVDGDRESPQADYAALLDAAPTFDV